MKGKMKKTIIALLLISSAVVCAETNLFHFSGNCVVIKGNEVSSKLTADEILNHPDSIKHPFSSFYFLDDGENYGVTNWCKFPNSKNKVGSEFSFQVDTSRRVIDNTIYFTEASYKFRYFNEWNKEWDRPMFLFEGAGFATIPLGKDFLFTGDEILDGKKFIIVRVDQIQTRNPEIEKQVQSTEFAWQQTDHFIAPNFESYFPDDSEGGRKLDTLWESKDKDERDDEEILTTVRDGLRNTTKHRTLILGWIGSKYIWSKSPQNDEAIEIMYHASDFPERANVRGGTRHYSVYYGLSVVNPKTPSTLRALADLCMTDEGTDIKRVHWGVECGVKIDQRNELISYLQPYLESKNKKTKDRAEFLKATWSENYYKKK